MTQVTRPSLKRPVTTVFVSERLVYRSVQASDEDDFCEIMSEPGCMEIGHPQIPRPPSRKKIWNFFGTYEETALIFVFICLREEPASQSPTAGKPIGSLNMSRPPLEAREGHRSTEFAIWLSEEYRSKGYGAEATNWAMDWAFNYAGIHRIELRSYSFNEAAIRLWEKVGFKLEGRKRESVWFQRAWYDTVMYAILEQDWEAIQGGTL